MRITGGAARGRTLRAPRGLRVRPTTDKVRAAIFDILGARGLVAGRGIHDLFSGSGALGLEALSRGAEHVVFLDASAESCRAIRQNVERSGFASRADVRRLKLPDGLRRLEASGLRFAGAFLDPPYRRNLADATLRAIAAGGLLLPDAWVIAEHAVDEVLADSYGRLRRYDVRRYGSTALSLFAPEAEP